MVVIDKIDKCIEDESRLKFTVVFVHDGSGFLFCRKRSKDTWECPGGHIEPGETAAQGALRELYEETGLKCFVVQPLFDYHAVEQDDPSDNSWGRVYLVRVPRLDSMPTPPSDFEMGETRVFAETPEKLSYPGLQGEMLGYIREAMLLEDIRRQ